MKKNETKTRCQGRCTNEFKPVGNIQKCLALCRGRSQCVVSQELENVDE